MKRLALVLTALCGLTALAYAQGGIAPDFTLKDLDGVSHHLADAKGKVVVLSFWMTWCVPCKMEMPQLKKLYDVYKDQGVEIWSITADSSSDMPLVKTIVRRYQVNYPVLLDTDSRVNALLNQRNDYPLTIVIDKQGKIQWTHIGYQPGEEKLLEEQIKKALTK